ncbi:MAG: peptide chain release factor 1 [Candidatus Thalassarchaeum betae]|jgi:peptide chain release factor subunit 1|uniref:Peptide chain release factor subunit 1 n=1 Tax=Candidatus Thalassarchaeum betae TaxID=2599289 RepID=A0A2V3HPW0_9ARCH|nr:MAG: peptide chain release factor 1 [Candidatus Thalassoarchaea betae]PXF27313.1 MAG: peptide chain release factor 1 [Euryarchaeota archaeon]HIC50421.1 peptide chain release factor 1 [Candidatus Poseidoniales archaeon]HIM13332.1 peptide chain release factor 1 [Candidatus Poseidoniales archaeon]HIM93187.1 peptide chain release factor 1 [Candidatus Poseidoniales archaeon]
MSDDLAQQQRRLRLKKALGELTSMRGMGTELVTVVVPPDRMIHLVRQHLSQESGQAVNIKSKSTRKHVADAIESAIATINRYKTPGERGIAIFVGHVIVGNNKSRLISTVIDDPPEPFTSFRYRCDSRFEVSQLEEMLIDRTAYGLFVIDRSESAYGLASGKRLHCQAHITSQVPSKHGRGGQSARRFERLIEEAAHTFFQKSAERACAYWLPMIEDLEGIIVGGPGATKDFVVKNDYFHHEIKKLIREPLFDVGYSNESGLRELIQRAGGLMDQIELDTERRLVDGFLREVMQPLPKATYGEAMVRSALEQGAVHTLLLSEALRKRRVGWVCKPCKHEWEATQTSRSELPNCPSCDSEDIREDPDRTMDLIDEMSMLAGHTSAKVSLVSMDTEEGATLNEAFGGIAAILRYAWS